MSNKKTYRYETKDIPELVRDVVADSGMSFPQISRESGLTIAELDKALNTAYPGATMLRARRAIIKVCSGQNLNGPFFELK